MLAKELPAVCLIQISSGTSQGALYFQKIERQNSPKVQDTETNSPYPGIYRWVGDSEVDAERYGQNQSN